MSVPIRLDLAFSQTHRITVDIFGFQTYSIDFDFISIPDEIPCKTSLVDDMPSVIGKTSKNQFHISLEIFDLAYYEE